MKSELGFDLTKAVITTADVFLREGQRLFRPHGLTAAQYNVLSVLAGSAPTGLSQRELGDVLVVDRSNVTGLVDRMEKSGWVRRADVPEDRRVYRVQLTSAGRKLWEEVSPRYEKVVGQVTKGLSEQQVKTALLVLQKLQQAAVEWELPE